MTPKSPIYEQLRDEAAECGFPGAKVRDVSFAILSHVLESPELAYAVVFPGQPESNARNFAKEKMQKVLAKRVKALLEPPEAVVQPAAKAMDEDHITAEENRKEIMASIQRLEAMKDTEGLDVKEKISIEKQLLQSRTVLKEKFEVSASAESQLIIVQPKCNHICEQTGRECWLQTKEYAMEHWDLVPRQKK